jgi:hypothetical protein
MKKAKNRKKLTPKKPRVTAEDFETLQAIARESAATRLENNERRRRLNLTASIPKCASCGTVHDPMRCPNTITRAQFEQRIREDQARKAREAKELKEGKELEAFLKNSGSI